MVRDTLGEDAIIVATREENGGTAVRVTAAVEPAFEVGGANTPAQGKDWLQYDNDTDDLCVSEELTDVMLRHNVPEDVMDGIVSCASVMGIDDPGIALVAAIEHLFDCAPLPTSAYDRPMMMIGPPGAGKTLAVAKMAARGVMNGLNIGVISTDTVRAGGVEQLESFTKLLNIDLQRAATPEDLAHMINDLGDMDQILIDTQGLNPFDKDDIKHIAKLIGTEETQSIFVLPAGMDSEESGEMAQIFSTIGTQALLATRIDMSRRIGGILGAAHKGRLALTDASNTPQVADGLIQMTPKQIARILMPSAFQAKRKGSIKRTHAA